MLKLLLAAASLLVTAPAVARDAPMAPTAHVTTADLDLAAAKDQKVLDRRISAAIDKVCRYTDPAKVGMFPLVSRCRTAALAEAQVQRGKLIAASEMRHRDMGTEIGAAK